MSQVMARTRQSAKTSVWHRLDPRALVRSGRYAHIDALRAVAVLMVVFSHAGLTWIPGGAGVTVFFVISGFIISHLVIRERARSNGFDLRGFYVRRGFKLFPPFIIYILVPTIVYSFFVSVDWAMVAAQLLFAYNWVLIAIGGHSGPEVLPGSGVTWSLAIEEQFYIVFAIAWLLVFRSRNAIRVVGVGALAVYIGALVLRVVLSIIGVADGRIEFGTDTRMDAIALGVLSAVAYNTWQGRRIMRILGSPWAPFAAVLIFIVSLVVRDEFFRETFRYSLQELSAAILVVYGLVAAGGIHRLFIRVSAVWPIQLVGLASYSIYLLHFPMLIWWGTPPWGAAGIVLYSVGATLVGCLGWLLLEKPVELLKNRWSVSHAARRGERTGPS